MPQADLDKVTNELGLKAHALSAAPTVKTHPARAARVALLHGWGSTQTEGWWRQAFDVYGIPYDYIDPQAVEEHAGPAREVRRHHLRPRRQPAGGHRHADVEEPDPVQEHARDAEHRHLGADGRHAARAWGCKGLMHLQNFIAAGGVFLGSNSSAEFAINNNFTHGVSANTPGTATRVVGSLLRTKLVDTTSPIVYGIPDNLAMYSDSGDSFSVNAGAGGGRGGGAGAGGCGRRRRGSRRWRSQPRDWPRHAGRSGHRPGTRRSRRIQPDAAAAAA